jgi:D-alanyl-D-alanine carboxypeptidase/D-alanyl-D-alanine-endopeptidase (penicillin-binding protein 4)
VKFRKHIPLILLCAALAFAAGVPSRLQTEINTLNSDEALTHGAWALCVIDVDSGKVIASNDPERSMIPASTMKVLTTGAAMGLLGKDYRYSTFVEYDGVYDIAAGVIHGNVFIRGTGDPTLGSSRFPADSVNGFAGLPKKLKEMGIRIIEGNIYGDKTFFSDNPLPDGWTWGDLGQYYGAGTSGLDYKDNKVVLHFNSMKGDSGRITRIDPQPRGMRYVTYVTCAGKKDEAYVYGSLNATNYSVYGSIPAGQKDFEVEASNPEPAVTCAEDVYNGCIKQGIIVGGAAKVWSRNDQRNAKPFVRKTLMTFSSPALSQIIEVTNKQSDNIYAEQLLRTLGALKGEDGTTEAGTAVVRDYWAAQGVNTDGMYIMDGSGLSRSNLVTTKQQAMILYKISKLPWYAEFNASLPVAGKEGSMSSLCKGTCAENNMRAKTGYINRARGYAGYVKTKSGRNVCFSVLANNYTCSATEMKKKLEKILVAIAEM